MNIKYIGYLKEDCSVYNLKQGTLILVTSELLPGSMTGCDAFIQGRVVNEDGHKMLASFDYFKVDKNKTIY